MNRRKAIVGGIAAAVLAAGAAASAYLATHQAEGGKVLFDGPIKLPTEQGTLDTNIKYAVNDPSLGRLSPRGRESNVLTVTYNTMGPDYPRVEFWDADGDGRLLGKNDKVVVHTPEGDWTYSKDGFVDNKGNEFRIGADPFVNKQVKDNNIFWTLANDYQTAREELVKQGKLEHRL